MSLENFHSNENKYTEKVIVASLKESQLFVPFCVIFYIRHPRAVRTFILGSQNIFFCRNIWNFTVNKFSFLGFPLNDVKTLQPKKEEEMVQWWKKEKNKYKKITRNSLQNITRKEWQQFFFFFEKISWVNIAEVN